MKLCCRRTFRGMVGRMVVWRRVRKAEHVARMGEMRTAEFWLECAKERNHVGEALVEG